MNSTGYRWMTRGRADHEQGFETIAAKFWRAVVRARYEAEARHAKKISRSKDWRASAWWLEHGPAKSRWAREQHQQTQLTANVSVQVARELSGLSEDELHRRLAFLDGIEKLADETPKALPALSDFYAEFVESEEESSQAVAERKS